MGHEMSGKEVVWKGSGGVVIDRGGRGPTAYCIELVIVDHCQNPRELPCKSNIYGTSRFWRVGIDI
jgi:hypothetical protein